MGFRSFEKYVRTAFVVFLSLALTNRGFAQAGTGTLRGQVTDPSGAAVAGAIVRVTGPDAQTLTAKTSQEGAYEVKGLAPGKYAAEAVAKGFALYKNQDVKIIAGQVQKLDIALSIEPQKQEVVVLGQAPTLDVNPANNAGAIVISGEALEALSDDPDELLADLQALAGPSAGPNGGQIYIDGFTAGQLPPKSSIREIRINQNPFSSEYDKLGYGRIEIFTKPGTDQFHGRFEVSGNTAALNSKNPFLSGTVEPGYDSVLYSGDISGPLSKRASFFFSAQRRDVNDVSAINATILNPNFNPQPFVDAVPNARTRTNISPRIDYQFGKNNILTVRYQYFRENETNDGIGQFSLPSMGYNLLNTEQTLQASDTQTFGSKIVNETRFQYLRERNNQRAQNLQPTVSVLGAFAGGGNSIGDVLDNQDHYELQNYTSMVLGKHFLKFGGRLRAVRDANNSTSQYNGTFTFPSLTAYQIEEQGLAQGMTPAQIAAAGGGPNLFTITTGIPSATAILYDAGLYVQDDWRVRPNMTLSYGLRLETQNDISNHADWAPRLAIAWGIGRGKTSPKTVLRAGWGIFYDRFTEDLVIQAERLNGVTQQQYVVHSPDFFPNVPPPSMLAGSQSIPTIYRIAPNLHAPYTMQTAVTLERQLTKIANLSVSYLNSRGVHQLLNDNINAPLPGTFNPSIPTSGVRPNGVLENIFQYESEGIFKQNQLIVHVNVRAGAKLMLFGYYTLNYANSDTSGANSSPSNPYDVIADYGRAAFDVRNRVFIGGTMALPYALRLSPFLLASSGQPFNVTVAQDLNGSAVLNQRPAFASSLSNPQKVVMTSLGTFDTVPVPGEMIIPINDFTGPGRFSVNLRLSKTFGFGKKTEGPGGGGPRGRGGEHGRGPGGGGGGPFGNRGGWGGMGKETNQRYGLTFSVSARNVFNHVNLATPIGVIGSPYFGQSNRLVGGAFSSGAASRLVYLQASLSF